jgi:hypothetical protein
MIKVINCDLIYLGPNPTGGQRYKVTDGTLSIEIIINGTLTDAIKKKIAINFDKSKQLISEKLKQNAKN